MSSNGPIYVFNSDVERIKYSREAACVQRTHAAPGIGDHSVGKHSFNMVTMLLIMWPEAPRELIVACIKHDLPERTTGDMPHPAKRAGIQNDEAQAEAEFDINEGLFGIHEEHYLPDELKLWLSGLDMLEFYCYCRDQWMMGNRSIETKLQQVEAIMLKSQHLFPIEIVNMYYEIKDHDWAQMPDIGGRVE